LLIESSNAYARGLLTGIADFVRRSGARWSIYFPETGRAETAIRRLRGWQGDGVIVRAESKQAVSAVSRCRCPVINVSAAGLLANAPAFHSDVRAEADAAFAHLWERGFRRLGFCGVRDYAWSGWQLERFRDLARASGVEISTHVAPLVRGGPAAWARDRRKLVAWLRSLPKPVGVFACYDLRGQQVLEACREAGLAVPDEVAVIGVDNDPVRCSLSDPPLSSVEPNAHRVGYLAASELEAMMNGRRVKPGLRLVPPLGVVARRSTDSLAIADPDVAAALRFIREHACEQIGVKQVLDVVPLSRRSLEARFVKLLGCTPHDQILRCRVERAKQLLSDTDLPIKSIAGVVGARSPEYLSVLFRRLTGSSPSAYRAAQSSGRVQVTGR
jgi:LacI family transcriptional regulator